VNCWNRFVSPLAWINDIFAERCAEFGITAIHILDRVLNRTDGRSLLNMCAHRTILGALVALVLLSSPLMVSPAQAQTRAGVQTGASLDPDQFFFGGPLRTPPLVDRVRFRPSADIGVGDNLTLIALNLDFTYGFTSRQPWSL